MKKLLLSVMMLAGISFVAASDQHNPNICCKTFAPAIVAAASLPPIVATVNLCVQCGVPGQVAAACGYAGAGCCAILIHKASKKIA
jgi:hypothetical protein